MKKNKISQNLKNQWFLIQDLQYCNNNNQKFNLLMILMINLENNRKKIWNFMSKKKKKND